MYLKSMDEFIECDRVFGPMPDFSTTFETFFIEKAYYLLFKTCNDTRDCKYISLLNENDNLKWMYSIELSRNSREQNLEIIYNNNRVYFKTVRPIYKHDLLSAFPSKDLEISLGLQFIPIHTDNKYKCKKCLNEFGYQYGLMLHSRYFCSQNINNLLKSVSVQNLENKTDSIKRTNANASKRKQHYIVEPSQIVATKKKPKIEITQTPQIETHHQTAYQNYLKLFQQSQQNAINQVNLKEQLTNQLLAYFETNSSTITPQTVSLCNGFKENTLSSNEPIIVSKQPSLTELNQMISSQVIQNWCAKCNTYFRLTSDLVYHMRTYHRKDNPNDQNHLSSKSCSSSSSSSSWSSSSSASSISSVDSCRLKSTPNDDKVSITSIYHVKQLKCDICNEVFKEKHHLSRHMTSHR